SRMGEFYRTREPHLDLAPVDLNTLARQVLDLTEARWRDLAQQRGQMIEMQLELAEGLPEVMGVASELREALTNLVFNALDALPEGGTVTLRTRAAGADEARLVAIEIADDGVGMDEEARA